MPVETKKSKGKDDEQWTASYLTAACKSVQDTRLFHNNHQSFCIQISIDVSNHKWQQKHQRALYSQGFWQATCDRLTREWSPLLSVAHWRTHSSTTATRTLAMWNEAIDPSSEFQPGFMMVFTHFKVDERTDGSTASLCKSNWGNPEVYVLWWFWSSQTAQLCFIQYIGHVISLWGEFFNLKRWVFQQWKEPSFLKIWISAVQAPEP